MTNDEFTSFSRPYADAMALLMTKLDILNHTLYSEETTHPISNIQNRIKTKTSIENKLAKKGHAATVENAKEYLRDIAGIRIVCYFKEDIYNLINSLRSQSDLIVCVEKDYIKNPKPNGYRSYHIVLGVPVYCMDGMEYFPVEIQLRTISMDFWASMEHRIVYKQNRIGDSNLSAELLEFATTLQDIEQRFESYREK